MSSKKEAKRRMKEERKRLKEEKKAKIRAQKERQKTLKREKKNKGKKPKARASSVAPTERPIIGKVIGAPTNFSHDTHVGWDSERGFEIRNIPDAWIQLFKKAGATQEDIENPETRKLMVDTVKANLMMDAVAPPPIAADTPPPPLSGPSPPSGGPPPPSAGPPPPSGGAPPPGTTPPAIGGGGGGGNPFKSGAKCKAQWSDGQFYDAVINSVSGSMVNVTFTEYGNAEDVPKDKIQLSETAAAAPPPVSGGGGGLLAGLSQAKSGLKTVDVDEQLKSITQEKEMDLAGSLAKALDQRRAGMAYSTYGGKEESDDDNQWDEDEEFEF